MKRSGFLFAIALLTALLIAILPESSQSTSIIIINMDGPGEGFNDPTPATPVGGNPGTTLGEQRLIAFQYAADLWGAKLFSAVPIEVEAAMDPLYCDPTSAVLGSAGTIYVHRDWTTGNPPPRSATWYPQALANAIAAVDLNPGTAEISATFNSNLNGDPGCLGGIGWYYGLDGNPGSDIDFVTVVFHEIGHGLGFQTFIDLDTGQKLLGYDDTYEWNMEGHFVSPPDYPSMTSAQRAAANKSDPDLHWIGARVTADGPSILTGGISNGHVRLYGPDPPEPGSSLSHWSTALTPDQAMEPYYTGVIHTADMEVLLMRDIGWNLVGIPTLSKSGLLVLVLLIITASVILLAVRRQGGARPAV